MIINISITRTYHYRRYCGCTEVMMSSNREDATHRERRRMHNLNDAFDQLRNKIPRPSSQDIDQVYI